MQQLIRNKFEGRTVVILGFGREGQASYTLIRRYLPDMPLAIADSDPGIMESPLVAGDQHLQFLTGPGYMQQIGAFDFILRSPGITVWPFLAAPRADSAAEGINPNKITSQTSLFLEQYAAQTIGVTGTKGKSTTSSLIHHILKTAGRDTVLAGNIGNPLFHFTDMITPDTTVVAELSSHQLEFLIRAPHISVFLNLFQEHLDAYKSYEHYQQAKLNITRFQAEGDILVYNIDDPLVADHVIPFLSVRRCLPFSLTKELSEGCYRKGDELVFSAGGASTAVWKIHQDRFLRGEHNLKNIMASINVALALNVDIEAIEDGIATFKGLEHRLEYVGEFHGIHFYNDSIATIPEACIEAIRAVPRVDTLVAGGFDRGISYESLGRFLAASDVSNFILAGEAGRRIAEEARSAGSRAKIFLINRFDEFAPIAFRETKPGHSCLLSPAAASYDEFRNFEERGKRFRELIKGS